MGTHPIFESDFDCLTEKIVIMADEISEKDLADLKIEENDEESTNYKAPAKKTINELNDLDAEDESLRKYKEALLGSGGAGGGDAKRVVVKKIELHSDDLKQPLIMDLTLAPEKIKEQTFKVKEGVPVDKNNIMVGSYAPKAEDHSFKTEAETAPSGMLARGTYKVKSKFIDDDKEEHASWEWNIEIAKSR